jgi:hypothetical protein
MADADQQEEAFGKAPGPSESTSAAVSQLFRDHNHMLVRYLTARLQSVQEAKEVAQESHAFKSRDQRQYAAPVQEPSMTYCALVLASLQWVTGNIVLARRVAR